MLPPSSLPMTDDKRMRWYRNLAPGEAFNSSATTLDFSLQLAVGIANLSDFKEFTKNLGGVFVKPSAFESIQPMLAPAQKVPVYSRDPNPAP